MKFTHRTNRGSVLLASLALTLGLVTLLTCYLQLLNSQHSSMVRSRCWNAAIAVAEAGIEEALTHINFTNAFDINGWEAADRSFVKTAEFGDGYYQVTISNRFEPVIVSEGFVRLPNSTNTISRKVLVKTRPSTYFSKAMSANGKIDLNGNNVRSDSFDSGDPFFSNDGKYDPHRAKANGDVATNSGLTNSLSLGNADVWGKVSTGPGGSVSIGPNGSVGDLFWQLSGQNGIKPGYVNDDMNVYFPPVEVPFSSGVFTPTRKLVDGEWVDYVIDSTGNWQLTRLNGSLLVKSNVTAVLLVTEDIALTGQNYIKIQPTGSLVLYFLGPNAQISGQGVMNANGCATNFTFYGSPNTQSITLTGNGEFSGLLYAPSAAITLKGGGSSFEHFIGSIVANTVTMNGNYSFHFDERLGKLGGPEQFKVRLWREI